MGVTELTWADFVIYSDNFVCVQRIKFEENVWEQMRVKRDEFYFMTFLPYYDKKMQSLCPVVHIVNFESE